MPPRAKDLAEKGPTGVRPKETTVSRTGQAKSALRSKGRLANYDLLRVIATLAVMTIHVNFLWFSVRCAEPTRTVTYLGELFLNIGTRFCVPCFVMLSGAFLLPNKRNGDPKAFYSKVGRRVYLPTLIVVLLLACYELTRGTSPLDLGHALLIGNFYNLWYLYMLAGLYALTPALVRLRSVVPRRMWSIGSLALLAWASATQPTSAHLLPYDVGVIGAYLGYYLVGDVLRELAQGDYAPRGRWLRVIAYAVVLGVLSVAASARRYGLQGDALFSPFSTFFDFDVVLISLCIFRILSLVRIPSLGVITWLSERSFSVYLVHTFVYQTLYGLLAQRLPHQELISIAIMLVLTTAISLALASAFDAAFAAVTSAFGPRRERA